MDTRLIRARIALFEGDRLEVQRLLEDSRHHGEPEDGSLLWLQAQAQPDHNTLVEQLNDLLRKTEPDDLYHQMAKAYLQSEDRYAERISQVRQQARTIPGVTKKRILTSTALLIAALILIPASMRLWRASQTVVPVVETVVVLATAEPTLLPDTSVRLNINDYAGRYEAGLLQIASAEDDSHRIVDSLTGDVLRPVEGSRFYALELYFECRLGICVEPPQATLALALDNDLVVPIREGATVQNGSEMISIALGRRTAGWVVFEVPVISEAVELIITPTDRLSQALPVIIPLPEME